MRLAELRKGDVLYYDSANDWDQRTRPAFGSKVVVVEEGAWEWGPDGSPVRATHRGRALLRSAGGNGPVFLVRPAYLRGQYDEIVAKQRERAAASEAHAEAAEEEAKQVSRAGELPVGTVVANTALAAIRRDAASDDPFGWAVTNGGRYADVHVDTLLANGAVVLRYGKV